MIDQMKKTLLAAVGAAAVTREQVTGVLDDLVKKGKMTSEEAQKTADEIMEEGKKEFSETRDQMDEFYESLLSRASVVSKEKFEALEKRVADLEAKVGALEPGPAPTQEPKK
jgi:polyhydroxyalkanoate synthesis regulator phasin